MRDLIRKLLDLLTLRDRREGLVLLVSMTIVALAEMAGIASIMPFMAAVTNAEVIHTNRWLAGLYETMEFSSDTAFLQFLGLLVVSLLVVGNLLKAANTWLTFKYHNKLNYLLAKRLLARYLGRPYEFFLDHNTSELGKNILTEARNVVTGVIGPVTELISRSLIALAILTLLVIVDPIVALAIATILGGSYGAVYLLARRGLRRIGREQVAANVEKYKIAGEALGGVKELKILGREETFLKRFAIFAKRHARNNVTFGLVSEIPRHALEIVAFGGILVVVLYLLGRGESENGLVPVLALYAFAGYRLLPALQQIFAAFANLRLSMPALEVLHRDLASEDEPLSGDETDEAATPALPCNRQLELRDLTFRYRSAGRNALDKLNLVIGANTSVGLVGPTGCGKTTTVDLILGLLAPTSGSMLSDDVPIGKRNMRAWRKNLGYVPQQIFISDDTIARNIAFGIPADEVDMQAVRRAATIANLAEFVETELPEGYETEIGERGVRLSGGQRQRIGIARALYRDPAVLVMDEATSALDGITEESVMDAVRSLSRKKTIILIAHRLTTVRECDVIYVLEKGRVLSTGTYDELQRESEWFRSASGATKRGSAAGA